MKLAPPQAVVIGASAGAIEALAALLPSLRASYPLPVVVVVHLPPDKENLLPELFTQKCSMKVCEAEDKQPLQPGTIYFAPPDYHLLIEEEHYFSLSNEEPLRFSRPSIDVTFESASDIYGEHLIGIILTGANDDGAEGLRIVADAGGIALVQNPQGAHAAAMPLAALAACPTARAMNLTEIAAYLQEVA